MKIYNMDIGWDAYSDTESIVLDAVYNMMNHDRGALHPFDLILSDLVYDGLETIPLTATQICRIDFEELHTETVSFTLGELFS